MQKKIIALAIAAAFSAPAFADTANVTVYGVANMSVDSVTNGDNAAGTISNGSATKVSSNSSRIGFKGSEDLGDGLSAIWQIESQVDLDNAGGSFGSRNTFLGLSDKAMGTVLLGKHDTPYKISTRALDVFGDGIADNRALMGGVAATLTPVTGAAITNVPTAVASFDGRQGNVIAYISPAMSGVTVAAAYVAGAESAATMATTDKGAAYSMAAMYKEGDLYASAAYEVHNFGTNNSGSIATAGTAAVSLAGLKESAYKFGVGYKIADLNLGAVYERTSDNINANQPDTNAFGHTAFYVAAKYALSSTNAVKAAYTISGATNAHATLNDNDARQMSVGFDHSMSKRTTVYALYTKLTNGVAASYTLSSASTGAQANTTGTGADQSAISVGMKHEF